MARAKSPEKREAILEAAVKVIAALGLEASTAKIASEAGVAEGTLFTYFENKDVLLNELYFAIKRGVYARINDEYPERASLERRARYVWEAYLGWAMEAPLKKKVAAKLYLSDRITEEMRAEASKGRVSWDALLKEIAGRSGAKGFSAEFVSLLMGAIQDATMEYASRHPKERKAAVEQGFVAFWRAVK